jgi:hypothetical protein
LLLFVTATSAKTQKNNKQSVKLKTRKRRASIAPSPKKDQKRFGAETENRGAPAAATKPIREASLSLSLSHQTSQRPKMQKQSLAEENFTDASQNTIPF